MKSMTLLLPTKDLIVSMAALRSAASSPGAIEERSGKEEDMRGRGEDAGGIRNPKID
jgi:hypothetical protein